MPPNHTMHLCFNSLNSGVLQMCLKQMGKEWSGEHMMDSREKNAAVSRLIVTDTDHTDPNTQVQPHLTPFIFSPAYPLLKLIYKDLFSYSFSALGVLSRLDRKTDWASKFSLVSPAIKLPPSAELWHGVNSKRVRPNYIGIQRKCGKSYLCRGRDEQKCFHTFTLFSSFKSSMDPEE